MTRLTGTDAWGLMEAYNAVYEPQEITEEQIWEEVELWVNSLVEEGYDLSECTWNELYDYYIEEGYKRMNRDKIFKQINKLNKSGKNAQASTLDTLSRKLDTTDERTFSTRESRKNKKGGSERSKSKHLQARDDAKKDIEKYGFHEEVDLYDVVLTHLIDEGYADTTEDAFVIMTNMSEDWKKAIIEGSYRYTGPGDATVLGGRSNPDDLRRQQREAELEKFNARVRSRRSVGTAKPAPAR